MGWTWKDRNTLLQLYPGLANSPILLQQWPGFAQTVAELRTQGLLPAAINEAAVTGKNKSSGSNKPD